MISEQEQAAINAATKKKREDPAFRAAELELHSVLGSIEMTAVEEAETPEQFLRLADFCSKQIPCHFDHRCR